MLVHGAGSGPWIFDGWEACFPGIEVARPDLHAGLDVGRASMADYAGAVVAAARELPAPAVLCGWSMGGLAVLMAAAEARPQRVVLLEPSAPAEVQGVHDVPPAEGVFDPEAEYGHFPPGQRARPESLAARAERKRGVSVPALPCPSLVVYGDEFRELRGHGIAALYGSDELDFPGLDHWDLVLDPRVRRAVAARLA